MMQEIELPDGTILEFPASMSDADVAAAVQSYMGGTPSSPQQPTQQPTPRTWKDTIVDNVVGRDDGVESFGEQFATLLNMGGEGLSAGLVGDEAAAAADAAIGRGSYDERLGKYRADESRMWDKNPALAIGSQVAPALLPGGAIARGAMKIPTVLGKMAGAGALSGATGATYGFMEGEGDKDTRVGNAVPAGVLSALIGGAVPGLAAAGKGIANSRRVTKALAKTAAGAPSDEALRAMGNSAYKSVDDMGAVIAPDKYKAATSEILDFLESSGMDADLTPKASVLADRVAKSADGVPGANGVPFSVIEKLRRKAGLAAKGDPADAMLAGGVKERIDNFLDALTDDDIVGGQGAGLSDKVKEARALWARLRKSEKLTEMIETGTGGGYLSGDASGIKNKFGAILRNPKLRKQFDDTELAAMRRVVDGAGLDFLIRQVGRFGIALNGSGSNAFLGLGTVGAGAAAGASMGPLGAMLGAAAAGVPSAVARRMADKSVRNAAEVARGVVAAGGRNAVKPDLLSANPGLLQMLMQGSATTLPAR